MVKTFASVENGLVVNIVVIDDADLETISALSAILPQPEWDVSIGDMYDAVTGVFSHL